MIVLGLDTATRATSVALCELDPDAASAAPADAGSAPADAAPAPADAAPDRRRDPAAPLRAIELRDDPPPGAPPSHARAALTLAHRALEGAGKRWEQLERIAVGIGPGTFTGLRIGIAAAHGLSLALGIELVGVSSLRALALEAQTTARERGAELICAVIDARRGEVFAACWRSGEAAREPPLEPPAALAPERLGERLAQQPQAVLAVGDGAVAFRDTLVRAGALVPPAGSPLHRVCAVAHCRLGSGPAAPGIVLPDYVRLPDAEPARVSRPFRTMQPAAR